MKELKWILIGLAICIGVPFLVYDAIDLEVARRDYVKNVEQCKAVEGCLFSWNCKRYNKMIEKECE